MLILFSTIILVVLFYGLIHRRNPRIHIPTMLLAFALDVGLVLVIEFSRQAVERVVSEAQNALLLFHAGISLSVLGLYVALIVSGIRILKQHPSDTRLHRQLAYAFLILRLLNYGTSFFVGQ